MKEILFRGKRVDNGEWVFWNAFGYITTQNGKQRPLVEKTKNSVRFYTDINRIKIRKESVGQYTGLTDKNGKKIFEGDICKTYFESYTRRWEEVGVVTEFCGAFGIESADGKHFRAFINKSIYTRSHEVIGNIYDNPELLQEDKE